MRSSASASPTRDAPSCLMSRLFALIDADRVETIGRDLGGTIRRNSNALGIQQRGNRGENYNSGFLAAGRNTCESLAIFCVFGRNRCASYCLISEFACVSLPQHGLRFTFKCKPIRSFPKRRAAAAKACSASETSASVAIARCARASETPNFASLTSLRSL